MGFNFKCVFFSHYLSCCCCFFAPSDSRCSNSCILAKCYPIKANHTSMESLCIQLSTLMTGFVVQGHKFIVFIKNLPNVALLLDTMVKGKKKSSEPSGRKITLKMAKSALKVTVDGKRRLDLSNMAIATFPKCILKLYDIEELDLSRNLLKKIPDAIDKFINLRLLDLHSNHLEQVPAAIGRLHNLYSLNLCNNHLSSIGLPHELGLLRNLRILNLGMNRIESLPPSVAALKELRELGLFNNLLTHLPKCIQRLPKLQKLNARSNPIPTDESPEVDRIQRAGCLYLVREDCLCTDCLKRCKEHREKLDSRTSAASTLKKSMFAGLMTPNSVAQENQALWRWT